MAVEWASLGRQKPQKTHHFPYRQPNLHSLLYCTRATFLAYRFRKFSRCGPPLLKRIVSAIAFSAQDLIPGTPVETLGCFFFVPPVWRANASRPLRNPQCPPRRIPARHHLSPQCRIGSGWGARVVGRVLRPVFLDPSPQQRQRHPTPIAGRHAPVIARSRRPPGTGDSRGAGRCRIAWLAFSPATVSVVGLRRLDRRWRVELGEPVFAVDPVRATARHAGARGVGGGGGVVGVVAVRPGNGVGGRLVALGLSGRADRCVGGGHRVAPGRSR